MGLKTTKGYRGTQCRNCEHPLDVSERFCPNCGQKNSDKRLSLNDFINELLANFYSYDSKIKRTVQSLFTKPGGAALEFISGKRAKYANPFRFYLSVSLVFFILNGFLTKFSIGYNHQKKNTDLVENKNFFQNQVENDSVPLSQQFFDTIPDSLKQQEKENLQKLDSLFKKTTKKQSKRKDTIVTFANESSLSGYWFLKRSLKKWDVFSDHYKLHKKDNIDSCLVAINYETTPWNRYLYKKGIDANDVFNLSNDKQKKAFGNFMLAQLPFLLFLALPFLTLNFSLLYFSKHLNYAEHLVFVFNFMTFLFLIFLANEIINIIIPFKFSGFITLGILYYFYRALRNFYKQGRWKTLLKFIILTFLLTITASVVAFFMLIFVFLLY